MHNKNFYQSLRLRVHSGVLIGKALLRIEYRVFFVGMLFGLSYWCPVSFHPAACSCKCICQIVQRQCHTTKQVMRMQAKFIRLGLAPFSELES